MTVASATIIHDVVLKVRDIINDNVTDPIATTRASTSKFCMTGFPDRPAQYPIIIVSLASMSDRKMGMNNESTMVDMQLQIDILAKDVRQKDNLADSVYDKLRTAQVSTTLPYKMYDFKLISISDLDEPGETGLRRKVMLVSYTVVT